MSFWNKTKKFLGFGDALENTKKKFTEAIETVIIGYARLTTTSWMIWRSP